MLPTFCGCGLDWSTHTSSMKAACRETGAMSLFWLSFCDPERPEGTQFLGVAIVDGTELLSATSRAYALGCNPGGEIMSLQVAPNLVGLIDERWRDRLLTRAEAEELDGEIEKRIAS